jgi:hypothetical protein
MIVSRQGRRDSGAVDQPTAATRFMMDCGECQRLVSMLQTTRRGGMGLRRLLTRRLRDGRLLWLPADSTTLWTGGDSQHDNIRRSMISPTDRARLIATTVLTRARMMKGGA